MCHIVDADDFLVYLFSRIDAEKLDSLSLINIKRHVEDGDRIFIEFSGSSIKYALNKYKWFIRFDSEKNSIIKVAGKKAIRFKNLVNKSKINPVPHSIRPKIDSAIKRTGFALAV